ncbi:hypothetical protein BKA82DRAFT_9367 [Pisolithus tinctorius]|uniref:Uncharacterized protein n=1 Tax=Pisolithus tinctorius Marx 270 TaxID=870435 RepID=A0A0C3J4R1_PISTI|nr:hypothetical protein BKA82DRAFT_9367 [Pisolithus tinctorius]KIO04073.1 hypothetical protein M404DRAFT_9367 [Pisolithus tinctorius Marx 270]
MFLEREPQVISFQHNWVVDTGWKRYFNSAQGLLGTLATEGWLHRGVMWLSNMRDESDIPVCRVVEVLAPEELAEEDLGGPVHFGWSREYNAGRIPKEDDKMNLRWRGVRNQQGRELTLAHYRHLCPDNGSDVDTGKKREVQMTSRTNGRLIASLSPSLQKIQHKPYQQNEGFAKLLKCSELLERYRSWYKQANGRQFMYYLQRPIRQRADLLDRRNEAMAIDLNYPRPCIADALQAAKDCWDKSPRVAICERRYSLVDEYDHYAPVCSILDSGVPRASPRREI